jgi:hypothetical protein
MYQIPIAGHTPLIRTDFSDDAKWLEIIRIIRDPAAEFHAFVESIEERDLADKTTSEVLALLPTNHQYAVIFIIDRATISHPELPILAVNPMPNLDKTIRVIPRELWGIENNLSIANMDFDEFASNADSDGIFRGFPE